MEEDSFCPLATAVLKLPYIAEVIADLVKSNSTRTEYLTIRSVSSAFMEVTTSRESGLVIPNRRPEWDVVVGQQDSKGLWDMSTTFSLNPNLMKKLTLRPDDIKVQKSTFFKEVKTWLEKDGFRVRSLEIETMSCASLYNSLKMFVDQCNNLIHLKIRMTGNPTDGDNVPGEEWMKLKISEKKKLKNLEVDLTVIRNEEVREAISGLIQNVLKSSPCLAYLKTSGHLVLDLQWNIQLERLFVNIEFGNGYDHHEDTGHYPSTLQSIQNMNEMIVLRSDTLVGISIALKQQSHECSLCPTLLQPFRKLKLIPKLEEFYVNDQGGLLFNNKEFLENILHKSARPKDFEYVFTYPREETLPTVPNWALLHHVASLITTLDVGFVPLNMAEKILGISFPNVRQYTFVLEEGDGDESNRQIHEQRRNQRVAALNTGMKNFANMPKLRILNASFALTIIVPELMNALSGTGLLTSGINNLNIRIGYDVWTGELRFARGNLRLRQINMFKDVMSMTVGMKCVSLVNFNLPHGVLWNIAKYIQQENLPVKFVKVD